MKHTLEGHKFFQVIAWVTFIGFVAFTFHLASRLQETNIDLANKTNQTVEALEATP